jgi:hypothetical protein
MVYYCEIVLSRLKNFVQPHLKWFTLLLCVQYTVSIKLLPGVFSF